MNTLNDVFTHFNGIIKDEHWFARGYNSTYDGHTRVKWNGTNVYLHRLAFCIANNLDYNDKSFQVNHKPECGVAYCWNPEHMYKGDHADNMNDRSRKARNASHCPNGHEYNEINKWHDKGCRLCLKDANERAKQRRKDLHANS